MKILIAPDSFKESLSASQVAKAIQKGLLKVFPEADYDLMPIGDGGEGTLEAIADSLSLKRASLKVTGPFGETVDVVYAYKASLAVFETAAITGLEKVPLGQRNPLQIDNRGIGEMICQLAHQGFKRLLIGVGGTSSHDGGIGLAAGLGYAFFDEKGRLLPAVGQSLGAVARISDQKVDPILKELDITIITDVSNPLCGKEGAAHIFGKQKGLMLHQLQDVDEMTCSFYQLVDPRLLSLAGAGAGGGMAAGLVAFASGRIVSGIDAVLDILDFDSRIKDVDVVIVGEGRMDRQSLSGKAPVGLARRVPQGVPVLAICGSLSDDLPDFPTEQITAAFPIIASVDSLEKTLARASHNLERTAQNIGNLLNLKGCKKD